MEYLKRPLTAAEVIAKAEGGRLVVVIAVDLYHLACASGSHDLGGLNDMADEMVLGRSPYVLADLSYRAVGVLAAENKVLIEVNADVSDLLTGEGHGNPGE